MLAKIPELRVPARTPSLYFKGKSEDIPTIAKRLLVAHVLEGSVRKAGDHLRVTAQLVRADTGYHVWSQTYDRKLDDIFKVQDDIAGAVVRALKVTLLGTEPARLTPTTNSEAYTLYVQARALVLHGRATDAGTAADYLRRAVQLDPKFAPAYARLTQTLTFQIEIGMLPYKKGIAEARLAAQKALELDPTLAAAHLSMARVHAFDWDWRLAETEIQRARQLDPGDADALRWAAILSAALGHANEAVNTIERAVDLDPLNAANYSIFGAIKFSTGDFPATERAYRKAIELAPPSGFGSRNALPTVLLASGRPAAALASFDQLDDKDEREFGRALALFALGRKTDSDAALADFTRRTGMSDAYDIAQIHACRGENDEAFVWLDRAYGQHDLNLRDITTDSCMTKLRGDLRFKAFLRKINLLD